MLDGKAHVSVPLWAVGTSQTRCVGVSGREVREDGGEPAWTNRELTHLYDPENVQFNKEKVTRENTSFNSHLVNYN